MTDRVRHSAPRGARLLAGLLLLGAVVLPTVHRVVGHTGPLPAAGGPAVGHVHAVCALCATVLVAVVPDPVGLVAGGHAVPFAPALPVGTAEAPVPAPRGRAPPLG